MATRESWEQFFLKAFAMNARFPIQHQLPHNTETFGDHHHRIVYIITTGADVAKTHIINNRREGLCTPQERIWPIL